MSAREWPAELRMAHYQARVAYWRGVHADALKQISRAEDVARRARRALADAKGLVTKAKKI